MADDMETAALRAAGSGNEVFADSTEPTLAFDRNQAVTIIIDGPAVAKGRPRVTLRGFVYTPAATRKYEAHGRLAAQLAMDGRPPIDVPISLTMAVELPIPISWSGRRRAAAITGDIRPTSRPDLDNYVKAAADAISGIVVADADRAGDGLQAVRHRSQGRADDHAAGGAVLEC
jgi:Holliday junction resolvase RusA-like endonuclease